MINSDFINNPATILIVDDEKTLRLVLRRALEKLGYRVIEACDGRHCLDICQQQRVDLVLLDAMMPGIDGFSCCTHLQTLLSDRCPPILMITALDDQESVDRAFAVGAIDYITKPIDWSILNQRINRLLISRWAITELQQKIQRECHLTVQMEAASRELQRHATVDILTQSANRSYFDEYLQREWNRLQKYQLPLSLILCNLNFLRGDDISIYPDYDVYLCQLADIIRKCKKRAADLVARYSAQEFAMILPNTEAAAAYQVAEAILSVVKVLMTVDNSVKISELITLNLGVISIVPSPESSINKLIKKIEASVYQAKLTGGDRIVILN